MVCRNCGKEINSKAKFCPKCGSPVANTEVIQNNEKTNTNDISAQNDSLINYNTPNANNNSPLGSNNTPAYDDSPVINQNIANSNKSSSSKLSAPRKILSIVICVFVFIFTLLPSMLCVARIGFQEDNIKELVSNEDLSEIKVIVDGEEESLPEYIIYSVCYAVGPEFNISKSTLEEVINDEKVNKIIGDVMGDVISEYTSMFVYGEKPNKLNEDLLLDRFRDVDNLIYKTTGYQLSYDDYSQVVDDLLQGKLSFLIDGQFEEKIGINPYTVSIIFSIPAICILFALDVGLIILLLKINGWKMKSSLRFIGVTLMLSGIVGLLLIVATVVFSFVKQLFLVSSLLRSLSLTMTVFSLIFVVLGFILLIIQSRLKNRR